MKGLNEYGSDLQGKHSRQEFFYSEKNFAHHSQPPPFSPLNLLLIISLQNIDKRLDDDNNVICYYGAVIKYSFERFVMFAFIRMHVMCSFYSNIRIEQVTSINFLLM